MAATEEDVRERTEDSAEDDDGQSIEDAAQEEQEPEPMQIPLPGTFDSISASAGGQRPTGSEIRLQGGKLPVQGAFQKGDHIILRVEAIVGEVAFVDTHDAYGNVESTIRVHKARPLRVTRVGVEE